MASANQPVAQLRIQCPACDQVMAVAANLAGKKVRCPQCGNVVVAQAAQQAEGVPAMQVPPPAPPFILEVSPSTPSFQVNLRSGLRRHGSPHLATGPIVYVLMAALFLPFLFQGMGGPGSLPVTLILFCASTVAGWWLFRAFCSPEKGKHFDATRAYAIKAFAFTAVGGMILLLAFQEIAGAAKSSDSWGAGPLTTRILYFLMKLIGTAYEAARPDVPLPSIIKFLSMLGSVAICEEVIKILPVVFLLRTMPADHISCRSIVFIGALSGLAFGVVESFFYCLNSSEPLGFYILRFSSCALGHGVYTMLSAMLLYQSRVLARGQLPQKQGTVFAVIGYVAGVCFLSALVHAIYNTWPLVGIFLDPGLAFLLSRWPVHAEDAAVAEQTRLPRTRSTGNWIVWVSVAAASLAGLILLNNFAGHFNPQGQLDQESSLIGEWRLVQTSNPHLGPKSQSNLTFDSDGSFSFGYMIGNDSHGYRTAAGTGGWQFQEGRLLTRITMLSSTDPTAPVGSERVTEYRIVSISNQELVLEVTDTGTRSSWARKPSENRSSAPTNSANTDNPKIAGNSTEVGKSKKRHGGDSSTGNESSVPAGIPTYTLPDDYQIPSLEAPPGTPSRLDPATRDEFKRQQELNANPNYIDRPKLPGNPETAELGNLRLRAVSKSIEAVCEQGRATKFSKELPSGTDLVGLEVTTAKFGKSYQGTAIGAIRPILRESGRTTAGDWYGTPHGKVTRMEAKPGFSISEIEIATGGRIMGLNVHFARSSDKGSRYASGWAGQRTEKLTKISCETGECAGLFGSWGKEASGQWPTTIRSLGAFVRNEP